MAPVKRIRRLLNLVDILQTGRTYNTQQLAELCDVSQRTIFRDISTLTDTGLNILYDEYRRGYRLAGNRVLTPIDLTLEEALSLIIVCENLGRPSIGLPFSELARTAVLKLHNSLPEHLKNRITSLVDATSIRIDATTDLSNSKSIYVLIRDAMGERKSVRIKYSSYTDNKELTTLLSVYRLMFCRHSWYVIGRSSIHKETRTFHLGRILEAEMTEKSYSIPQKFTLERYLGNAWQMIRQKPYGTKVSIIFSPKVARNVAEVKWHKSQVCEFLEDGRLHYSATVDGIEEIQWWILGYGSEAKVLEPAELCSVISSHAKKMLEDYTNEK